MLCTSDFGLELIPLQDFTSDPWTVVKNCEPQDVLLVCYPIMKNAL